MIHLARMGWSEKGKNRIPSKEPVPNIQHWRQEFVLKTEGQCSNLYVINQTSEKDEGRKIEGQDFLFEVGVDKVLQRPDSVEPMPGISVAQFITSKDTLNGSVLPLGKFRVLRGGRLE